MIEQVIERFNKKRNKINKSYEDNLELEIIALAIKAQRDLQAVIDAKIDFSIDSLGAIDEYLEEIHQEYVEKGSHFDQELHTEICFGIGTYIGETIRNSRECRWKMDKDEIPCLELIVTDGEHVCFPLRKVAKRLANGEEDNIQGFAMMVLNR